MPQDAINTRFMDLHPMWLWAKPIILFGEETEGRTLGPLKYFTLFKSLIPGFYGLIWPGLAQTSFWCWAIAR
jgi:hypothetical protein